MGIKAFAMKPKRLEIPLDEQTVRELRIGDMVLLNGLVVTGRDRVHKFLFGKTPEELTLPVELNGLVLYHCGPLVRSTTTGYEIVSAGPTTSARMDIYEPWVIEKFGIRGIIGKGGMGEETVVAMKNCGCVYFHAVSGAAALLAKCIKKVVNVWQEETFGTTEAMWILELEDFPAVITIDAHGNSLHDDVLRESEKVYRSFMGDNNG